MDRKYCPRCKCLVLTAISDIVVDDDITYIEERCISCGLLIKGLCVDRKAWEALH